MFLRHTSALFLLVFCLAACTNFSPSFTQEIKSEINTLRVVSFVPQKEIHVQIHMSSASGGMSGAIGLAGALVGSVVDDHIESGRAKKAEARIMPYRAVLNGHDARKKLQANLEKATRNLTWTEVTEFVTDIPEEEFEVNEYLENIEEDALLVLKSQYSLTPELESLEVFTRVEIYSKRTLAAQKQKAASTKSKKIPPDYVSGMMYQSKFYSANYLILNDQALAAEIAAVKKEYAAKIANAKLSKSKLKTSRNNEIKNLERRGYKKIKSGQAPAWLENNGGLLINTFAESVATQSNLLQLSLQDPLTELEYKNDSELVRVLLLAEHTSINHQSAKRKGWTIDESANRKTIRLYDGIIYSIDKTNVVRPRTRMRGVSLVD